MENGPVKNHPRESRPVKNRSTRNRPTKNRSTKNRPSENRVVTIEPRSLTALGLRSAFGGLLMGLANLVPGISGGTMLLAAGIYPRVIAAIAEVSTLRFRFHSIFVLGAVAVAAALGIFGLAGAIKNLVVEHRWVMYSLFIGLTLGGLPVVWRMSRPATRSLWFGAAAGFVGMAALGIAQSTAVTAGEAPSGFFLLALAGAGGAAAMILPGVSGGYILLILGQYIPILGAVDAFQDALRAGAWDAAVAPAVQVLLPVAIGMLIGVVAISNVLRWLLRRHEKATLGVLIGLLLGAVIGLWPFQRIVEPVPGQTVIRGQVVTVEGLAELDRDKYPTEVFRPTGMQVAGAVVLIVAGFAITTGVARIGGEEKT